MQTKRCGICNNEIAPDHNRKYCSEKCIEIAAKLYADTYNPKRYKRLKTTIREMLGNKCARCGFSDIRALQIDHIGGNGLREIRSFKSYFTYYQHILNAGGKGYQLLCANCNWIKRVEKKEGTLKCV